MAESVETSTRVVVASESLRPGSVLPSQTLEMKRQVFLSPGCEVQGAVFGDEIRIEGPAQVRKSVYATRSVEIFADGLVRLDSVVGAREAVVVHPRADWTIIQGNVFAKQIRLCNAIVLGAVLGDDVFLSNVRCLGVVRGNRLVEVERSAVLTVSGAEVVLREGSGLILPFAEADHRLELSGPIEYLGADQGDSWLTSDDISRSQKGRFYLTAGRRLTDLVRLRDQLGNVANLLVQISMKDAIDKSGRNNPQLMFDRARLPARLGELADSGLAPRQPVQTPRPR